MNAHRRPGAALLADCGSDGLRLVIRDRLIGQRAADAAEEIVQVALLDALRAPAYDPARASFNTWVQGFVRLARLYTYRAWRTRADKIEIFTGHDGTTREDERRDYRRWIRSIDRR
jgi:DNA-directed RNA polymerase specialized sigma24 family protein